MKIKTIRKVNFSGDVYNFHCMPNENYFANGVLVHNCYKSNTSVGENMSLETFKKVFEVLDSSKTMTQIAFGVDAECKSNPETFEIFKYCSSRGVTPNVTVADIDLETSRKLVQTCGAVAVSVYQSNKNCCYNSVKLLLDEAKLQKKRLSVNIHALLSVETYDFLYEVLDDIEHDDRLNGLNAIVFLSLKQKGRGEHFNVVNDEQYKRLIDDLFKRGVRFGMDSCSANSFLKAIADRPDCARLTSMVEPCESLMFSTYVNVKGEMYPCSFIEGTEGWEKGVDLTKVNDFISEVWNGDERVLSWRKRSCEKIKCDGCNSCPVFKIR